MVNRASDLSGRKIGDYELLHFIGHGASASVYLAHHVHLKSWQAIKILKAPLEQDKFLKEARLLATLEHPHILPIQDYGVQGSVSFLVMEYAPNGSLRDRLPQGKQQSVETILHYLKQIALALDYLRSRRVIHRD